MSKLSISKAWDETRETFSREGNLLAAVALALLVLPQAILGVMEPPSTIAKEASGWSTALMLLAAFIGIVGQLALIRLAIRPSTSVGESISHGARRFPATLGALFILSAGITILLIPVAVVMAMMGLIEVTPGGPPSSSNVALLLILVLGALAFMARFILMLAIASEEAVGPLAIIRRSWSLSAGHYWRLLAFLLIIIGLAVVLLVTAFVIGGLIAKVIGGDVEPMSLSALLLSLIVAVAQAIFTILSSVMLARIYVQLSGAGAGANS